MRPFRHVVRAWMDLRCHVQSRPGPQWPVACGLDTLVESRAARASSGAAYGAHSQTASQACGTTGGGRGLTRGIRSCHLGHVPKDLSHGNAAERNPPRWPPGRPPNGKGQFPTGSHTITRSRKHSVTRVPLTARECHVMVQISSQKPSARLCWHVSHFENTRQR